MAPPIILLDGHYGNLEVYGLTALSGVLMVSSGSTVTGATTLDGSVLCEFVVIIRHGITSV